MRCCQKFLVWMVRVLLFLPPMCPCNGSTMGNKTTFSLETCFQCTIEVFVGGYKVASICLMLVKVLLVLVVAVVDCFVAREPWRPPALKSGSSQNLTGQKEASQHLVCTGLPTLECKSEPESLTDPERFTFEVIVV